MTPTNKRKKKKKGKYKKKEIKGRTADTYEFHNYGQFVMAVCYNSYEKTSVKI